MFLARRWRLLGGVGIGVKRKRVGMFIWVREKKGLVDEGKVGWDIGKG